MTSVWSVREGRAGGPRVYGLRHFPQGRHWDPALRLTSPPAPLQCQSLNPLIVTGREATRDAPATCPNGLSEQTDTPASLGMTLTGYEERRAEQGVVLSNWGV